MRMADGGMAAVGSQGPGDTMTTRLAEQEGKGAGTKAAGAAGPEPSEEGQLADLPWAPTRTFKSGGAIIFVNEHWCKGCGICVEVCPKNVLVMDAREKPALLDADHCTGCLRCELLCPDFALLVMEPRRGGQRTAAFMP
jgi:2-oxoglutarate ferredoxin oxidoreductase subunit delta